MKNPLSLLNLILILTTTQIFSQFQAESFSVSKSDLETNVFAADSTANALVIYEYGNSYIDKESYNLITEIKRKIKILNKEGFEKSNVEIFLYHNNKRKEKVEKIIATTYNLNNNEVTKDILNKNNIYTEDYNEKNKVIKFTLPNIQEGSVITYSYTLKSPFIYKYHEWNFQEDVPKLFSEYNTSIPANYDYFIKLVGALKLDVNTNDIKKNCLKGGHGGYADCSISKYIMKNVPAFIEEDYLTAKKNYISRIEYELNTVKRFDGSVDKISKTWKDADKEIKSMPTIGKQLHKKTNLSGLIASSNSNSADKLSFAKDIYKFIQERFTWNKKHRLFQEVNVKDLEKNRTGNAAEINILLHNALHENGYNVKPVLISTRKNGLPTKLYPVISEFNYLIVKLNLNGKDYFLDGTDKFLSFGQLPFKCLNDYGRLLDFKNGSQWIEIKAEKPSFQQHQIILSFNDDNHLEGTLNSRYSGYYALSKKRKYFKNPETYLESLEEKQINTVIKSHEVSTKLEDAFFKETIDIVLEEKEMIGDKLYLDPFIIKLFKENPFKLQERTYAIDFGYKSTYLYSFDINLNDKYEILETPEDLNLRLPNKSGSFMFTTKVNETGNSLKLLFKVDYNKSIYSAGYYESLKKLMNNIVNTQLNSVIVLKKK